MLQLRNEIGRSRTLLVLLALVSFAPLLLVNHPAQAAEEDGPIASVAKQYLGTHGGQCWTFMRQVVYEATGRQIGFDYRLGFFEAGATEVSAANAQNGDIIQIASDANTSPWASYNGLHTAIILENLGGGVFNAIDSNQNWDEMVRMRPNYDPYAGAARNGLQVHIYHIPGGGPGDAGSPAVAQSSSTPATWSAGATGVVQASPGCLNLRTSPSLSGGKIDCLPSGLPVTAISDSVDADGFTWVQVQTSKGTGWAATKFLSQTAAAPSADDAADAPAAAPAPSDTAVAQTDAAPADAPAGITAHVDGSPGCLRVRNLAGIAGSIVDCLTANTAVTITDDTGVQLDGYTWVQVQTPKGAAGWVAEEFLVR